jgi:hypothetical protein
MGYEYCRWNQKICSGRSRSINFWKNTSELSGIKFSGVFEKTKELSALLYQEIQRIDNFIIDIKSK